MIFFIIIIIWGNEISIFQHFGHRDFISLEIWLGFADFPSNQSSKTCNSKCSFFCSRRFWSQEFTFYYHGKSSCAVASWNPWIPSSFDGCSSSMLTHAITFCYLNTKWLVVLWYTQYAARVTRRYFTTLHRREKLEMSIFVCGVPEGAYVNYNSVICISI